MIPSGEMIDTSSSTEATNPVPGLNQGGVSSTSQFNTPLIQVERTAPPGQAQAERTAPINLQVVTPGGPAPHGTIAVVNPTAKSRAGYPSVSALHPVAGPTDHRQVHQLSLIHI